MKYQYEPLADEYEFQTFLKELFNELYDTNSFEEYGTRGQAQYGIDIYSPELRIAIQAKKKDINRNSNIIVNELLSDLTNTIKLISRFPHKIDKLYFATTTKKHIQVQDACLAASSSGKLKIHFLCWSDIQIEISKFSAIRNKYFPNLKENLNYNNNTELRQRLYQLEQLITQHVILKPIKKQFRSIPNCDILLPDVEMEHLKYLIGSILKIALYRTFSNIKYLEFTCLFNYSDSFTNYGDGSSAPGFEIISGQVTFLGECTRLVKTLQYNNEKFFQILQELEDSETYNMIKLKMAFLPFEGLTAYTFKVDGQTNMYEICPSLSNQLDYEKVSNLSHILPFIASTTQPFLQILNFDEISKYPALMKFIHHTISENEFKLNALRVNVDDFEDWDYDYNIKKCPKNS